MALKWAEILAIATQQTDVYQMQCTAYKVAPDDGLIQSETCRASNGKQSLITSTV